MTWLPVGSLPTVEVNALGEVRRTSYTRVDKNGVEKHYKGKVLTARCNGASGYDRVYVDGKDYYIHRLVCEAFNGFSLLPCVDHKDGDRKNNKASNLRWCTYQQNIVWSRPPKEEKRNEY